MIFTPFGHNYQFGAMTPQPIGWAIIKFRPKWQVSPANRGVERNAKNRSGKLSVDIDVVNRYFTEQDY